MEEPSWMDALGQVGGWIVAAITAIGFVVVKRLPEKGSTEHKIIDQLQEQVQALSERSSALTDRVSDLERESRRQEEYVRKLQRRDLAWARHFNDVSIGIAAGTIPPMPPIPDELMEEI